MIKVAGQMMGEDVLAGSMVASRGHLSRIALSSVMGGAVGSAISGAMGRKRQAPSTPGGHTGLMYLAVGSTKLAVFSVKQGWLKNSIEKLLTEHSRADVVDIEVQSGVFPKINILLADGTDYALECARILMGKVEKVKATLHN